MESKSPESKRAKVGDSLEQVCINTIRVMSADVVQKAKSGHPGAPIGCAPMAHALWGHVMRFSPSHPDWVRWHTLVWQRWGGLGCGGARVGVGRGKGGVCGGRRNAELCGVGDEG